jgi:hypothetical protein
MTNKTERFWDNRASNFDRYYINGKASSQKNNQALTGFFRSVLAGKDPDLGDALTGYPQIFTLR